MVRLILASTSPQRKKILSDAGYAFAALNPGDAEERAISAATPAALAVAKACAKAEAVAATIDSGPAVVIGADTLVSAGGEVVGKPLDRLDAKGILTRLSGTRHEVISGLCLLPVVRASLPAQRDPIAWTIAVSTWVTMRKMEASEIEAYVASGEADGKAGAYAIQEKGDRFVDILEGSLSNVVGFPLEVFQEALPRLIKEWGFDG